MKQLSIFDAPTTDSTGRKIGFKNRWHIRKDGKHVALAVPGESAVHIWPGIYQDVIPYPAFDLSYAEYAVWIDNNDFVEVKR